MIGLPPASWHVYCTCLVCMSQIHLTEKIATYKDVAGLLFKYLPKISDAREDLVSEFEVDSEITPSDDANAFADDLEKLGPTFIKVGQLLSTRADLMPPEWISALQRLQDDVDPVPYEDIQSRIEDECGVRISKMFSKFDETPLASASIGQVHRATLRDGVTEVVVKVQRPGVRERIAKELSVISRIAEFLQAHSKFGASYDVVRIVEQFRNAITGELNYLREAQNLRRLAENLKEFRRLTVPLPLDDFCAPGVLTMEMVTGTKVTDLSGVVLNEIDSAALAEELFHAYLKQILLDGFFHADPHPGNILLTEKRKLALIDLGMVGTVSDDLKDHLIQLLGAVSEGRSDQAAKVSKEMGMAGDSFRDEPFEAAIKQIVEAREGSTVENLKIGSLVMDVTGVCGEHDLHIPDAVFMIGKMLLNLDIIGNTLAPEFNPDASIRRHLGELARKRLDHHLSVGNIVSYLTDVKELFSETPGRINRVLDKVADNKLKLEVDAIDEELLLKGFHRVANRITVGLILSALIVGASMLMNIESKFTLLGYPGLAMIFFSIAAVGGLVLVFRILFGKEK